MDRKELISLIQEDRNIDFETKALHLFAYQYEHNTVYRNWVDHTHIDPADVKRIEEIPFLPISAFKSYKLHCELIDAQTIFTSSGTTGSIPSQHFVFDLPLYLDNTVSIFENKYGKVEDYCFLALLPSYLERTGSSLIAMVDHFIEKSKYTQSGFYLYNHSELKDQLLACRKANIPTVLFGVSFALLDFIEEYQLSFPDLIVIETGGMKGRKKEITRQALHDQIAEGFDVAHVHSEYGMTELFSQAYASEAGFYENGYSMQVIIKDITDPFQIVSNGKTGIINIIDLANVDSCAFIETQDLGRLHDDGRFEVLGRLDVSDVRGCNLMVGEV